MIGQTRAELLKIRSTRTTLGLALGMIAIILLFVLLTSLLQLHLEPDRQGGPAQPVQHRQLRRAVLGARRRSAGHRASIASARSGRRSSSTAALAGRSPRRSPPACSPGSCLAVVGEALSLGVGALVLNSARHLVRAARSRLRLLTLGTLVGTALWGAIGVGLGMIVRNQVGAIIGLLAWGFVVENLLFALAPSVGRLTPGEAQNAFMGLTTSHLLSPAAGGAVLLAWTVVMCLAGTALTARRDVN